MYLDSLAFYHPQNELEDYNTLKSAGRLSGKVRVVRRIAASGRMSITIKLDV